MTVGDWIALGAVCASGAMSPGPSLAVVVQSTMAGGRGRGVLTAWSHAMGVAVYALLSALGLAAVVTTSPVLFAVLKYGGAAFLVFLAVMSFRKRAQFAEPGTNDESKPKGGPLAGLLISLLNPKIAIWFLALFGQFVQPGTPLSDKLGMAAVAWGIDGVWYTVVAFGVSWGPILEGLRKREVVINRVFAVVLILVAAKVAWG